MRKPMQWLLTTILCVTLIEVVIRLPIQGIAREVSVVGRKAMRTVSSAHISDHWKERALLAYSGRLFLATAKLCGVLFVIAVIVSVLLTLFSALGFSITDFVVSAAGIVFSLVFATAYVAARKAFA